MKKFSYFLPTIPSFLLIALAACTNTKYAPVVEEPITAHGIIYQVEDSGNPQYGNPQYIPLIDMVNEFRDFFYQATITRFHQTINYMQDQASNNAEELQPVKENFFKDKIYLKLEVVVISIIQSLRSLLSGEITIDAYLDSLTELKEDILQAREESITTSLINRGRNEFILPSNKKFQKLISPEINSAALKDAEEINQLYSAIVGILNRLIRKAARIAKDNKIVITTTYDASGDPDQLDKFGGTYAVLEKLLASNKKKANSGLMTLLGVKKPKNMSNLQFTIALIDELKSINPATAETERNKNIIKAIQHLTKHDTIQPKWLLSINNLATRLEPVANPVQPRYRNQPKTSKKNKTNTHQCALPLKAAPTTASSQEQEAILTPDPTLLPTHDRHEPVEAPLATIQPTVICTPIMNDPIPEQTIPGPQKEDPLSNPSLHWEPAELQLVEKKPAISQTLTIDLGYQEEIFAYEKVPIKKEKAIPPLNQQENTTWQPIVTATFHLPAGLRKYHADLLKQAHPPIQAVERKFQAIVDQLFDPEQQCNVSFSDFETIWLHYDGKINQRGGSHCTLQYPIGTPIIGIYKPHGRNGSYGKQAVRYLQAALLYRGFRPSRWL